MAAARIVATTESLLCRRVVARLSVNVERWKSFGREQLNFDFSPGTIVTHIAWFISEDILVTQLHSNFGGDVGKIAQAGDWEYETTRHFSEFGKQTGSVALLGCSAHIVDIKNPHGVKLAVCFLEEIPNVRLVVATMIIASVGDDEQGPLAVLGTPHLAQAEVNSIE